MRFVFHIGAGKTGTSTIQSYLSTNRRSLIKDGVYYAGMRFEAGTKKDKWKKWQNDPWGFKKLSDNRLTSEFCSLFDKHFDRAVKKKCHTIILSNESVSNFVPRFMPFIEYACSKADVTVSFYVREPESWIISAYQQWGIKMGRMVKNLFSFAEFKKERGIPFTSTLQAFEDAGMSHLLQVRNMSACDDVLDDFLQQFSLPIYGSQDRVNERKSDLEQMIYYIINENAYGGSHKDKQELIRDIVAGMPSISYGEFVDKTYPKLSDFEDHQYYEEIRRYVNTYLPESQRFDESSSARIKDPKPLISEDNFFDLVKVCVSLGERVEQLEKRLDHNS